MRRLLLLLLTVLGCWLGSGPAGLTYAEPASPVSTYTYDVPADLSMVAEVTANRGPPSSTYGYGTYDAVDRWSHGAQARPETTLSPSTTTHAHTGVLTQAVRATTTTGAQVGSTHGDFSSLHRSGVAAETGPGRVAIGENMEERVQPYADRVGADTYQPDPSAPRETWEQNQRDWINKQMDDGREIHDVGPDPARPNYPGISSKWYQIERDEIERRGYPTIPIDLGW